jgi:hypothetical protein
MTFPTGLQISTSNLDSPDRDPSLARADLLSLAQAFNQVTASANAASGVVVLNASGKLAVSQLPTTLNTSGDLTLNPSTRVVNIRDVLRLQARFADDNQALTDPVGGDIIYLVDGDAGRPCLSVYDGTDWRVVRFATTVGAVGATLTTTSTIVATADV